MNQHFHYEIIKSFLHDSTTLGNRILIKNLKTCREINAEGKNKIKFSRDILPHHYS